MDKIDFVITWVDGGDEEFIKLRSSYQKDKNLKLAHYRDYGMIKYLFRGIEKFAPWVNNVFFVTCGQKPDFLNINHPKLKLISHKDYMPSEYLPTFSVNPIELNFHRIKGLSEKFVYFNDDTLITSPVKETDFFKKGLPCDSALFSSLIPSVKNEVITYIIFNDLLLINANYSKKAALKKNFFKYFSLKYGKGLFKNLYYLPIGKFSGFVNPHQANSFLKSSFESMWEKEGEYLDKVCKNKFRTMSDVNQYLIRYSQLAEGKFYPRSDKIGKMFTIGEDNSEIQKALFKGKYKLMCINDNSSFDEEKAEKATMEVISYLEKLLPEKSSFEV